jgi:hypothetical protein
MKECNKIFHDIKNSQFIITSGLQILKSKLKEQEDTVKIVGQIDETIKDLIDNWEQLKKLT